MRRLLEVRRRNNRNPTGSFLEPDVRQRALVPLGRNVLEALDIRSAWLDLPRENERGMVITDLGELLEETVRLRHG